MTSNAITAIETNWTSMLGDWSTADYRANDLLIILKPHMLKKFPTIELFNKNYDLIKNILISKLSKKNAAIWKKSKSNLGQHHKEDKDDYSDERTGIRQMLLRQMKKLEGIMFQADIIKTWDTVKHFDIEEEIKVKKRKSSGSSNKKSTTTSSHKSTILDDDYDGSEMFGAKVCKYFKKVKGSNHKAAFYDGEIVAYNKA
jgi:hypothetical protein